MNTRRLLSVLTLVLSFLFASGAAKFAAASPAPGPAGPGGHRVLLPWPFFPSDRSSPLRLAPALRKPAPAVR